MAVLASSQVDRVLRKIRPNAQLTTLAAAISSAGATTISLTSLVGISAPARLEVNSEILRVTATDDTVSPPTATVVRGFLGSIATTHSNGDVIYVARDDFMFRMDVLVTINEALEQMYPTLHKEGFEDLVYDGANVGHDMPLLAAAGGGYPLAVWAQNSKGLDSWKAMGDWEFQPGADPDHFASGKALMVRFSLERTAKIRVVFPQPFTRLANESDDLEADGGLKTYMTDIPYYYAMGYLIPDREIARAQIDTAVNHQRAQDVPAFLSIRTSEWYKARYQEKMIEAKTRQMQEFRRMLKGGYGS